MSKGRVNSISPATRHNTGEPHPQGVRGRTGSRKGNRLAARQASHAEYPVRADGKEGKPGTTHPQSKRPGSLNPRKH